MRIIPYVQMRLKAVVLSSMIMPINYSLVCFRAPEHVNIMPCGDSEVIIVENLDPLRRIEQKRFPSTLKAQECATGPAILRYETYSLTPAG